MGKDLLQMFSLSQYIYCIIALLSLSLSHTHKKKIKEHRINNPFPLRMNNGSQAKDCLEMKAETNYHATDSINI